MGGKTCPVLGRGRCFAQKLKLKIGHETEYANWLSIGGGNGAEFGTDS